LAIFDSARAIYGEEPIYYALGETASGRYLFCVVIQFPDGRGYPVTARPMTTRETALQQIETMRNQPIPETDSIEELAAFWDTLTLTGFEDQLEEVAEPIFVRGKPSIVEISLKPSEIQKLKRIARSEGIEEASLLRQWIERSSQGLFAGEATDVVLGAAEHSRFSTSC
jgi:hypothetical protein